MHYLYPVHSSRSFLFTPTLSSALYLMLLHLVSGHFDLAFRLADFCVADTALTPEERQLVKQVGLVAEVPRVKNWAELFFRTIALLVLSEF